MASKGNNPPPNGKNPLRPEIRFRTNHETGEKFPAKHYVVDFRQDPRPADMRTGDDSGFPGSYGPPPREGREGGAPTQGDALHSFAEEPSQGHFDFGYGPTKAHRHRNPDGSLGGWVAESAYVAPTVNMSPDARVYGKATVWDNAHIMDHAVVRGSALIYGDAIISGTARVEDEANVYGNARILDNAHLGGRCVVFDSATVDGNAYIGERAYVINHAHVSDNVFVGGSCTVRGSSHLRGSLRLQGELDFNGSIRMGGDFPLDGKCLFVGNQSITEPPPAEAMRGGVLGYSSGHSVAKRAAQRLFMG